MRRSRTWTVWFLACLTVLGGLLVVAKPTIASAADSKMYWVDAGTSKIQRANLDGTAVEDLVTSGLVDPRGIALDLDGGKMYVADQNGRILRANLDGTGLEAVVTGLGSARDIALDVAGLKMYWTDRGTQKIQRANLDGTDLEDLVSSGLVDPLGIALDIAGSKMYWTDFGTAKIQRANLNGTGVEDLVTAGLSIPNGIALDVAGGKMYWTDQGTNKIQRANLDGTGVEDLITAAATADPFGITLDLQDGKMYWTDTGDEKKIQRANLDGSGVEALITTGLGSPVGIALQLESNVTLTALAPAKLWLGVTNSDSNGRRIDLRVEVYKNADLIGEGQLLNRQVAGNALANSTEFNVPLSLIDGPVDLGPTDLLIVKVLVRRVGGSGNFGARLWYGNSIPPPTTKKGWSRFGATIDANGLLFYLRGGACPAAPCNLPLDTVPGTAGVASVQTATPAYLSFGAWSTTLAEP
jgi:DNA-binding beta-propeller fold protein YncE